MNYRKIMFVASTVREYIFLHLLDHIHQALDMFFLGLNHLVRLHLLSLVDLL
jgi:hypothetical protein